MVKRAVIYARVSTQDQDPEMQTLSLRDYAEKRGFQLVGEYVDVISGLSDHKANYRKLLDRARKREIDVIMVWKFDRLARSTKALLTALDEFHNLGIDFISYQENIDTTSPLGRVMFTIIGAIAEFEREMIVQRVRAGLAKAKRQGKRLGRPAIQKYQIERFRKLRTEGLSIRKIANRESVSIGVVSKYLTMRS